MANLAIFGGNPILNSKLPAYPSMGDGEKRAVERVVASGCLSGFYGSWSPEFWGGPEIKSFESEWSEKFQVKHSVTVNSAASGLMIALGAIGIGPGEEVIVPPYTMSATCMAPLFYGAIPVFADVEDETFCLSLESIKSNISEKTRAILVVNLFGHPAPLRELRSFCDSKGIFLIEDNAQSPLAKEGEKFAGTIGHIGIFSLNYHKHIHTGEGGVCVTNDENLALRLKMIRNHGENVTEELNVSDITNIVGLNVRMTELSAAIGREQLRNSEKHVQTRVELGQELSHGLKNLRGITVPKVRESCTHVYYLWAAKYDETEVGVPREIFSRALAAEGFPHGIGYVRPLYMLPIFQKRIAIGSKGFPFNLTERQYKTGLCPVAENLFEKRLLTFEPCAYLTTKVTRKLLIDAFVKVYENRNQLKDRLEKGDLAEKSP